MQLLLWALSDSRYKTICLIRERLLNKYELKAWNCLVYRDQKEDQKEEKKECIVNTMYLQYRVSKNYSV